MWQVLTLYVRDEQLSGNCPLPRHRLAELTSVLKAVTLLVATLKSSNLAAVHQRTWQQVRGEIQILSESRGCCMILSVLKFSPPNGEVRVFHIYERAPCDAHS